MLIDPTRFRDLPLLTRATAQNDYSVMIDGLVAGHIILRPAAPDPGVALAVESADLGEAKSALRSAFDRLLYWADMAKDGELRWNVPSDPPAGASTP